MICSTLPGSLPLTEMGARPELDIKKTFISSDSPSMVAKTSMA